MSDNIVEINGKKYKADAWQIWNGGENPVPGKLVQPQLTSESRDTSGKYSPGPSDGCRWKHIGQSGDIVCYRVMEEVKPGVVEFVTYVNVPCKPFGYYQVAKITFNLVDGTPDPKSIKLELL